MYLCLCVQWCHAILVEACSKTKMISCCLTFALNCFDKRSIFLVIFQVKMSEITPFQILNFVDFLLFFVLCDSILNILWFWTVGRTKRDMWRCYIGLQGIVISVSNYVPTYTLYWSSCKYTDGRIICKL